MENKTKKIKVINGRFTTSTKGKSSQRLVITTAHELFFPLDSGKDCCQVFEIGGSLMFKRVKFDSAKHEKIGVNDLDYGDLRLIKPEWADGRLVMVGSYDIGMRILKESEYYTDDLGRIVLKTKKGTPNRVLKQTEYRSMPAKDEDGKDRIALIHNLDPEILLESNKVIIPPKNESDKWQVVFGMTSTELFEFVEFKKYNKERTLDDGTVVTTEVNTFSAKVLRRIFQIIREGYITPTSAHVGIPLKGYLSDEISADGEFEISLKRVNSAFKKKRNNNSMLGQNLSIQGYVDIGGKLTMVKGHALVVKNCYKDNGDLLSDGFKVLGHHFSAKMVEFKKVKHPFISMKWAKGQKEAAVSIFSMLKVFKNTPKAVEMGYGKMVREVESADVETIVSRFAGKDSIFFRSAQGMELKQELIDVLFFARSHNQARLMLGEDLAKIRLPGTLTVEPKGLMGKSHEEMLTPEMVAFLKFNDVDIEKMEAEVKQLDGTSTSASVPIVRLVVGRDGKTCYASVLIAGTIIHVYLGTMDFDDKLELIKTDRLLPNGRPMFLGARHPVLLNGALICDVMDLSGTDWIEYPIAPRYFQDLLEVPTESQTCWIDKVKTSNLNRKWECTYLSGTPIELDDYKDKMRNVFVPELAMGPFVNEQDAIANFVLDISEDEYQELVKDMTEVEALELHGHIQMLLGANNSDFLDFSLSGEGSIYNHLLYRDVEMHEVSSAYKYLMGLLVDGKIKISPTVKALKANSIIGTMGTYEDDGDFADYEACLAKTTELGEVLNSMRDRLCDKAQRILKYLSNAAKCVGDANACWAESNHLLEESKKAGLEAEATNSLHWFEESIDMEARANKLGEMSDKNIESILNGLRDAKGQMKSIVMKADFCFELLCAYCAPKGPNANSRLNTRIGNDQFFYLTLLGLVKRHLGLRTTVVAESQLYFDGMMGYFEKAYQSIITGGRSFASFNTKRPAYSDKGYCVVDGVKHHIRKGDIVENHYAISFTPFPEIKDLVTAKHFADRKEVAMANGYESFKRLLGEHIAAASRNELVAPVEEN